MSLPLFRIAFFATFIIGCASPEIRTSRIAVNENDWNRALASIETEIARSGGSAEAWHLRGLCYQNLKNWAEMSASFDRSLAISEQFKPKIERSRATLVAEYFDQSAAKYDSSQWVEALAYIDTAIVIDPSKRELYLQAAVIAYYGEMPDEAIHNALRAVEMEGENKKDLSAREILVSSFQEKGQYDQVIHWAKDLMGIVNIAEDESGAYLRSLDALVNAYDKLGKPDKVEDAINSAIERFPDRVDLKSNLAQMLIRGEDYRAAETVYREILRLQPDHFEANLNLGTILINDDRWTDSIPYLERAASIDPKNVSALKNLAAAYYNTDQESRGAEALQKIKDIEAGE